MRAIEPGVIDTAARLQETDRSDRARRVQLADEARREPSTMEPPALQLQRMLGNRATGDLLRSRAIEARAAGTRPHVVHQMLRPAGRVARARVQPVGGMVQARPAVDESGDRYEQEAERVAARMAAGPAQHDVGSVPPGIQRAVAQPAGQIAVAPSVARVLKGTGRPLEPALQTRMEQRFDHDFSEVRVHTGTAAEQSARDMQALAYTSGQDMVFGAGRFAPGTQAGQRLLAHELAHVVQQTGGGGMRAGRNGDGLSAPAPAPRSTVIQRKPDGTNAPDSGGPAEAYDGELQAIRYAIGARQIDKLADGAVLHRATDWTVTGLSDSGFYVGPFTSDMGNFFYVYRFVSSDEEKNVYRLARGTYAYGWGSPTSVADLREKLAQVTGGSVVEFTTTGLVPTGVGAAPQQKTGGAPGKQTGTPQSPAAPAPATSEPVELTPYRAAWLKAGRENMKNQINALFSLLQKLKADRISVWTQNAEIEDPKPLRIALEVTVSIVGAGMGGVIGRLLSNKLAQEIVKNFVQAAGKKATELAVQAIYTNAVAPAREFMEETTKKALAKEKGTNATTALASKSSMLACYAEAMRLQTLSEENTQHTEFNKEVDAKYSDVALADLVETYQTLYDKLRSDPSSFLRELSVGLIRLKDEMYVQEKAKKYGGDVEKMLEKDPTIHETERRSGNLLIVPPRAGGMDNLGEWYSPTYNFAGFIGLSTEVNQATLSELNGTPIKDLPLTLGFRFWASNPFKGWGLGILWTDIFVKVWFERRADGTIWVDLDEADDEGLEWLASYYLNKGEELSKSEREDNAPNGARRVYEHIKNKPLIRAEDFDIF